MRTAGAGWIAAALLASASCAWAATTPKSVTVRMETAGGRYGGEAILINQSNGVKFEVYFENLNPGNHSLSVHQGAKCDAPSFQSAGPRAQQGGSIPAKLTASDAGKLQQTFFVKGLTLKPGAPGSVFANGGTSLILRSGAGDQAANASGNSTGREACGIISMDHASNTVPNIKKTEPHVSASNH